MAATGSWDLTWTGSGDDVGVEGYEVLCGDAVMARTNATSARLDRIPAQGETCCTVRAFDAAGNRSPSSAPACMGNAAAPRAAGPRRLAAAPSGPGEVALEWEAPAGDAVVVGYEVMRGDEVVARVAHPRARVVGVGPARPTCFTVRAVDEAGRRSKRSAQACAAAPDVTPPTAPARLSAEARPAQVLLRWEPSTDDVAVAGYEVIRGEAVVARVAATSISESGLRAAVEHCYAVRAYDAAGNRSPLSGQACATPPDVTPPSAPADVVASASIETEVVLRWSPSVDDVGVVGYEVFRGEERVASSATIRAAEAGLRAGNRYCYVIRAYDAAGNRSAPSAPACVSTPDLTPPTTPASIVATPGQRNDVSLLWSAASDNVGVAGYEVFRDQAMVATASGTIFHDTGLAATRKYCYSVRALDAAGNRSPRSDPVCAVPPDTTPPTVPPNVVASARSEHEVAIRWGESHDDVGVTVYEVRREPQFTTRVAGTSAREAGLSAATRYCYTVRALDAAGNRSDPSEPACATTPDLTPPTTPTQPVARATSDRAVELTWGAAVDNVGVAGYEIRRGNALLTTTESLGTTDIALEPGRKYCYTVVAFDAARNRSGPTPAFCATTPDLTPPTTPENLVAAPGSSTEMLLGWDESRDDVGVAGYEVLRAGALVAKVDRTRAEETGLAPLNEYCYAVRAFDGAGNRSKPSAPVCATTPDPRLPIGPTRLRAEAAVAREVVLRWEASRTPGVAYVVYWQRNGWRRLGTTPQTSFKIFGPAAQEQHCYRVSAIDAEGHESPSMPEVCARAGESAASAMLP